MRVLYPKLDGKKLRALMESSDWLGRNENGTGIGIEEFTTTLEDWEVALARGDDARFSAPMGIAMAGEVMAAGAGMAKAGAAEILPRAAVETIPLNSKSAASEPGVKAAIRYGSVKSAAAHARSNPSWSQA